MWFWSIFPFLLVGQKKMTRLIDQAIYFCPVLESDQLSKKTGQQKKSREWTKKMSGF